MTIEQKIIKTKVGILELAKQLGNVSKACQLMGYSRDSFYRFKELGRGHAARYLSTETQIVHRETSAKG
jgi:hypothetical protein